MSIVYAATHDMALHCGNWICFHKNSRRTKIKKKSIFFEKKLAILLFMCLNVYYYEIPTYV